MGKYRYKIDEICALRDGRRIYCNVYLPLDAGEKLPTVFCCHGYGGSCASGAVYAAAIAESGMIACCFDFCGGAPDSLSDGKMTEMSIFTERQDLLAVMDTVLSRYGDADPDRVFLMGKSMGGVVCAITAAELLGKIKGLILMYPAFVLVDDIKAKFGSVSEIPDTFEQLGLTIGRVFAEKLLDYDVYKAVSAYRGDVLIIHGDNDGLVPLSYSEKALTVYSRAELKIIHGAGHGFEGEDAKKAIGYISEYLESHI